MAAMRRDFLSELLAPLLASHGFRGSVVVQSYQSEAKKPFQLQKDGTRDFVKGVVGWVDLQSVDIEDRLA